MTIKYASTRGHHQHLEFADAMVHGLAPDGGLYCPIEVPALPPLDDLMPDVGNGPDYVAVAQRVMWPYVDGSIDQDLFNKLVADAYSGFTHSDICPVIDIGDNIHLLDLTRGPTLAFKDVALQLLGRLLGNELSLRSTDVTVVTATSGDTGSAAIEALAGRPHIEVVVLHPHNRVSEVQRRQMTTVIAPNIHNVAIEGTFDDCQDLVKTVFSRPEMAGGRQPAAVNSINWARVMAQIVYYVSAAMTVAPGNKPVSFSVPTGNFGNILSAWYAKRMGLCIDQLIIGTNRNDVLTRFFETGRLEARKVEPSISPSMDVQISSNFERLLWEASGRDGAAISQLMKQFRSDGVVDTPEQWATSIRSEMSAARLDDAGIRAEIKRVYEQTELVIDPHTAVGVYAARTNRSDHGTPMVVAATADPAKFGSAVKDAVGFSPMVPPQLVELFDRDEHYRVAQANTDSLAQVLGDVASSARR